MFSYVDHAVAEIIFTRTLAKNKISNLQEKLDTDESLTDSRRNEIKEEITFYTEEINRLKKAINGLSI